MPLARSVLVKNNAIVHILCQQVIEGIYVPELRVSNMFRIISEDLSNILVSDSLINKPLDVIVIRVYSI